MLGPPVGLLQVPVLQGMEGLGKNKTKTNKTSNPAHVLQTSHMPERSGVSVEFCDRNRRLTDSAGPVSPTAGSAV